MSRAVFLDMTEKAVIAHCAATKTGISSIQTLPTGGTRLVCMSVYGAAQVRRELAAKLMKDDAARQQRGPGWGFIPRS
jgi:hypothetical protein